DAPAFIFERANVSSDLQLMLRQPARQRLGWIEARKVLADDFVGLVAFEALGAGVPGLYMTSGIQHENGVVTDAFNQQAKALLGLADPGGVCGSVGVCPSVMALVRVRRSGELQRCRSNTLLAMRRDE